MKTKSQYMGVISTNQFNGRLESGEVCYGILEETGIPEPPTPELSLEARVAALESKLARMT